MAIGVVEILRETTDSESTLRLGGLISKSQRQQACMGSVLPSSLFQSVNSVLVTLNLRVLQERACHHISYLAAMPREIAEQPGRGGVLLSVEAD